MSHVRTCTIVHNMNLSHMKKIFKSNDENWYYLLKIHTRNLKCSFHLTGTKIRKGRAGGKWLQMDFEHCTSNLSLSPEISKKPLQHILYIININVNNRYNVNQQMYTLRYNYNNVFIHVNYYMFPASLAHHQGEHRCIKQSLHHIIISSMWNCHRFINEALIEMNMCNENYKILNYKNYKIFGYYNSYI